MAVRCLQSTAVGIYLPAKVEVALSQDGKDFAAVAEAKGDVPPEETGPLVRSVRVEIGPAKPQSARFVRVKARNVRTIPAGHPAAGEKAWLFADEILVNP